MKFVVAPDSYKGSLTAVQVGEVIERAIRQELPEAEVTVVPMADGGEGTVAAVVAACRGELVPVTVTGPLGEPVDACYGIIDQQGERTAVLEAANLFGLPMVPADRRNPLHTTSAGLGEAMRHALDGGIRRMVIGLGGSATNDGGLGLLRALGAQFTGADGEPVGGFGRDLALVVAADFSGLDPRLAACAITVASDVTNPLCGAEGASNVYGPQKGATPELVALLDGALARYADVVTAALGTAAHRDTPGAGSAGGLGFALLALGASVRSGAEVVARLTGLQAHIRQADWVLTGEGRSDGQTLFGKLPFCVASWAKDAGKRAVLISGSLGAESEKLFDVFDAIFAIVPGPASLEACMAEAEPNLYGCTRSVVRLIRGSAQR
ncbi:glycerate kinase [Paenibacillus whitsoniae]|uniref:Glycerate kinase n=1 Tax=Paenibacillus whitsoniae TaxID=2496558 RepID=A0A3S0CFM9_9BACL|nr:glycerate kinase [Paenibacillus whitsoniae]RTE11625.1 glycerate kinase [Paenibacillus whitsoniae]